MTYLLIFTLIVLIIAGILYTINRIRLARHRGKRLPRKNLYYATVAKLFMKDLPD